jgi:hypothetical protein
MRWQEGGGKHIIVVLSVWHPVVFSNGNKNYFLIELGVASCCKQRGMCLPIRSSRLYAHALLFLIEIFPNLNACSQNFVNVIKGEHDYERFI